MAIPLSDDAIIKEMSALPLWQREGTTISRTFSFTSYLGGIAFVNAVAQLAEEVNHHPDLLVLWRKVSVTLTTHSKGGLTDKDFALAHKIDESYSSASVSVGV